jgi:hypothetical protein
MDQLKNKSKQILECPHCGNKTQQEIIFRYDSFDKAYSTTKPDESIDVDITYSMTKCTTCSQVSLYINSEFDDNPGLLNEAFLAFPHEKRIERDVPEIIAKNYQEAKKVMKISRPAFAILIRRGLEFMCDEQKAKGRTLKGKLDNLVTRGIIPSTLAEMGDTLRFLGNVGAHASDYEIDRKEIEAMNDFYW